MSDPSRPPSGEMTTKQKLRSIAPDAYYKSSDEHMSLRKKYGKAPDVQELFASKRMTARHAVELIPTLHSKDHVKVSTGKKMATTQAGPGVPRKRSGLAKDVANAGYFFLPEEHPYASKGAIHDMMEKVVRFENMGTMMCLGRLKKYLPEGSIRRKDFEVPDEKEVRDSLRRCGLYLGDIPPDTLAAQPLLLVESTGPGTAITITKHSYNGLPTEGNSDDNDAMAICQKLARKIGAKLEQAHYDDGDEGVVNWINVQRERRPHLTTLMGRAKDDCYDVEKYEKFQVRFYTAWPRPIGMLTHTVTQTHAKFKKSIFDQPSPAVAGETLHGFSGVSLAHGGAERLVQKLQEQLDCCDVAHVVMGDDSLVFIRFSYRGVWYMLRLSLDCSSFDLTQVGFVSHPVHDGLSEELARFNRPRALLWRELMKKRDIVIDKTLNYELQDMGTSGGDYQSEINSVLMDMAIARFERLYLDDPIGTVFYTGEDPRPLGHESEQHSPRRDRDPEMGDLKERFVTLFLTVARGMGFVAKVEDAVITAEVSTIKEQLKESPMLFVGYNFHINEEGRVQPFCDLPRSMSQLVYPKGPKLDDTVLFNVLEAVRLAGTVASMGVPPRELVPAYEAMRMEAVSLLRKNLDIITIRDEGADFDPSLKYSNFLEDSPLGPDLPRSIEGLLRLLLFGTEDVWMKASNPKHIEDEYGLGSLSFEVEASFPLGNTVAEGVLDDPKMDEAMKRGNPFEVLEHALKKQTSVAREERPASKRTQGRPPPITTEAEVAERAAEREVRRIHQQEERRNQRNPFEDLGGDDEEDTGAAAQRRADDLLEIYRGEFAEGEARERAQSSTFGSEKSDDEDDALSTHTISSDEAAGTSYGKSRASRTSGAYRSTPRR